MENMSSHFSSILSFFYKDECQYQALLSIYKKKIEIFEKFFDFVNRNNLPPYQEMQRFFTTTFMANANQKTLDFKLFFKMFKECFICLIAIYEFLSQKSFDCFTNYDWQNMNPFMSNDDMLKLRLNLFKHSNGSFSANQWDSQQDDLLKFLIKKFEIKTPDSVQKVTKISWTRISKEFDFEIQQMRYYKTDKQCKERWLNHLCPSLKKEKWSLSEDITLLTESLKTPKKWSTIGKKITARNCHQIKNRFICLMAKGLDCSAKKIRKLINENMLTEHVSVVLGKISQNYGSKQNEKKKLVREKEAFCNCEVAHEMGFEKFINFQQDCPCYMFFD